MDGGVKPLAEHARLFFDRPEIAPRALEVADPYPAPREARSSLSGEMNGVPGPVLGLARDAHRLGWVVRVQHSIGCLPHATTGRPGPEREWFAVVMRRGGPAGSADGTGGAGFQAYGVYGGGVWSSCAVWDTTRAPFAACSVSDVRSFLAEPGPGQGWYDAIRQRQAEAAARQKAAAAARPRKGTGEGL